MLAGAALATAFPKFSYSSVAWIVPGLWLWLGRSSGSPFRTGFIAGMSFALAALHWLLFIPVAIMPIFAWLALSAYLGLYYGSWVCLCTRLRPQPRAGESEASLVLRVAWALGCAVLWVALEMIVGRMFSGFPWLFLGGSQFNVTPVIQIASVTGIYGVSFLAVWFSVALIAALERVRLRPGARPFWLGDMVLPLLTLMAVVATGFWKIAHFNPPRRTVRTALIQPSIPQVMIWDPQESNARFRQLIDLSRQALREKPDLILWPEASVPKMLRYDQETFDAVTALAREHQVWMILGVDDAEPAGPGVTHYFNSSFLVSPQGKLLDRYNKRQLVIFGEYIPLVKWLPFIKYLTPIEGGFTAGTEVTPFRLPGLDLETSVLICFEDVFPHVTRSSVAEATDFLINLTNDGWFGEGAAHWQQAGIAAFRAVENGLPLVRAANNGISCWVDAIGVLHAVEFPDQRSVYAAGYKIVDVPLMSGAAGRPTFYRRHGDWFGWGCVAVGGWLALRVWRQRRGKKRQSAKPPVA